MSNMSIDNGHHCCGKQKVKRGLWSPEEDEKLISHIHNYGHGSWSSIPKIAGLERCGKSCRLRWINYLRPDLKRGSFSEQEERIIIDMHRDLGNRWAQIAKQMPGRTDNEVKNFWNSCIKKKLISQGLDPNTHNRIIQKATSRCDHSKCNHDNISLSSTIPAYLFPNPNMEWTIDHFQVEQYYPRGIQSQPSMEESRTIPSYSNRSYPSELNVMIEHCRKWGSDGQQSKMESVSMKMEERCEVENETGSCSVWNYNGGQTTVDGGSFGSCNLLDFDFLESTLMPCEMDYHLTPIMDQVAWHRN